MEGQVIYPKGPKGDKGDPGPAGKDGSGGGGGVTSVSGTAPIASSGGATPAISLNDGGVTLAKMANLAQDTAIGRVTASTGVPETFTVTAAGRALVDDADAAAQRTTLGLGTLATQSGTFSGTSSGTNTGDQTSVSGSSGSCTGLAATATALATPRAINGVNFDGTAPITVTAAGSTLTGTTLAAGLIGTAGTTACAGNDSRLSDSRTPTAHATTHEDGGSDATKVGAQRIPTASVTLAAGYSLVVSEEYEIAAGLELDINETACLEVLA
jgi:hypothetical protein